MSNYKKITQLLDSLDKREIINLLFKDANFPDEPRMHIYGTVLNGTKKFSDGLDYKASAGGFSFSSRELALLKCLSEAAERYCLCCYRNKDILYSTFKNAEAETLDPFIYRKDPMIRQKKFGWVKGQDLIKGKKSFIPAQLIYLNYKNCKNEVALSTSISTGAAGGFEHHRTILRGIYEIVERDAFMVVYLARISAPKVDLDSIHNKLVQKILAYARRYNLELMSFDLTNDLGIPSFLGAVVDKSGLGPGISLGLKSSLDPYTALIGSIEETFHTRPWLRKELFKRQDNNFNVQKSDLSSIVDRGLIWMSPKMLKHLDFLLNQPTQKKNYKKISLKDEEEYSVIIELFKKEGMNVFNMDITLDFLKKIGYKAYKVLIPQLQPLYLNESQAKINYPRLKKVSNFFGQDSFKINKIPHPFL